MAVIVDFGIVSEMFRGTPPCLPCLLDLPHVALLGHWHTEARTTTSLQAAVKSVPDLSRNAPWLLGHGRHWLPVISSLFPSCLRVLVFLCWTQSPALVFLFPLLLHSSTARPHQRSPHFSYRVWLRTASPRTPSRNAPLGTPLSAPTVAVHLPGQVWHAATLLSAARAAVRRCPPLLPRACASSIRLWTAAFPACAEPRLGRCSSPPQLTTPSRLAAPRPRHAELLHFRCHRASTSA